MKRLSLIVSFLCTLPVLAQPTFDYDPTFNRKPTAGHSGVETRVHNNSGVTKLNNGDYAGARDEFSEAIRNCLTVDSGLTRFCPISAFATSSSGKPFPIDAYECSCAWQA